MIFFFLKREKINNQQKWKCKPYLSPALSLPVAGVGKKKVDGAGFVAAGLADGVFIHETIDGRP